MYELLLTDCLEYMKTCKRGMFKAIITDPPYGVEYRNNDWDKEIPPWIESALSICDIVIFTTAPTTMWDYPRPDWVCDWHRRAAASRSVTGGFNHWSPILVYGNVKFPVDYYETAFGKTVNENFGIDHPSPKPVELYKWLIENATSIGDTVFDPFMGSGTTGVAALKLGRKFVGCENVEKYYKIAERRIASASMQTVMF